MAAILGGVVVEGAEASRPEFSVVEPVQEHPHRSVESLRTHAVAILLLQALGRIPHALGGGVKAVFDMFRQFLRALAGAEETGNLDRRYVLTHEKLALSSLVAFYRVGRAVMKSLVDPFGPHCRRLNEMGISGDDNLISRHGLASLEQLVESPTEFRPPSCVSGSMERNHRGPNAVFVAGAL